VDVSGLVEREVTGWGEKENEAGRPGSTIRVSELVVTGDWNDIDAAMQAGIPWAEAAIMESRRPDGRSLVVEVKTIVDQVGRVEAVWIEGGSAEGEGARIRLRSRIGEFGDVERETRIVGEVAKRLGDLQGVEVAPAN
jgi:hypothetical protein